MKKLLFIILLIPFLSFSQNYKQTKNYISIGFLDHKTGITAIGYTRSILQNGNNELFVGFGSMIAVNTFVVGYKKYLLRSFIDGYSVASMQKIYGMGGDFFAPAISIGFEKKIWKFLFINIGAHSIIRLSSQEGEGYENNLDNVNVITFPNLNLNFRY